MPLFSTLIRSRQLNAGADVNVADSDGATPLRWAAGLGNAEIVAALLYCNAGMELAGQDGEVPLHRAAGGGHFVVTDLLLAAGANCDVVSSTGMTPLHKAFESEDSVAAVDTALTLLDYGAGVDCCDGGGNTALHWAALNGHQGGVELLLDCCCDVSVKNAEGETAMSLAMLAGNADIVKMLQAAGARD